MSLLVTTSQKLPRWQRTSNWLVSLLLLRIRTGSEEDTAVNARRQSTYKVKSSKKRSCVNCSIELFFFSITSVIFRVNCDPAGFIVQIGADTNLNWSWLFTPNCLDTNSANFDVHRKFVASSKLSLPRRRS